VYVPKHFKIEDPAWIREFLDAHAFGTLINVVDGEPFATHLPMLYAGEPAPLGRLRGHMARANPQWKAFGDAPVLAIFAGPHAYVSPTWYESDGPSVPTWNYTTVHVYGRPRIVEDRASVEDLLRQLVDREEAALPAPWSFDGLDATYREHMIGQIVAFEIPVARIEAKAKLSQNRTPDERRRVADAIADDVAATMRELELV